MYCVIKGDFDFSDTELETINSLKVCQKKKQNKFMKEKKLIVLHLIWKIKNVILLN